MAQTDDADRAWGRLAEKNEDQRSPEMRKRYDELLTLSEEERQTRLKAMAHAEYALPDLVLRQFTHTRLRVWMDMDPQAAFTVARSYDAVMDRMPGAMAMKRATSVQMAARELPVQEQERLRTLLPHALPEKEGETPRESNMSVAPPPGATPMPAPRTLHDQPTPVPSEKRSRWAFWKKAS